MIDRGVQAKIIAISTRQAYRNQSGASRRRLSWTEGVSGV